MDEKLKAILPENFEYEAIFVPLSQSRNAKSEYKSPSDLSINWRITFRCNYLMKFDYMQGIGHLPEDIRPKFNGRVTIAEWEAMTAACESARFETPAAYYKRINGPLRQRMERAKLLPVGAPDIKDVLYSVLMDGEAIDYPDFESWANEFGYDPDSREAEKTYKACVHEGLQLRAMLGDKVLSDLREYFQDY